MHTFVSRALLPVGLLWGLTSGCAHSGQTRQKPVADSTGTQPPPATVTSADIRRNPQDPIEASLMGRFPGVVVSRTADGGVAIRIRGQNSLVADNQPLYVLDGIPIQPSPNGSLSGINPYDIESIRVLKDPAETAAYGLRGANGVILIKTKRAGQ